MALFQLVFHFLHLTRLLLETLAVGSKLFMNLSTVLSRKNIFQLKEKFLLFANQCFLRLDFFCLADQPSLECLYLQNTLIVILISRFKFTPTMHIHWICQFILQCTNFRTFIQQFFLLVTHFCLQIVDALNLVLRRVQFVSQLQQLFFFVFELLLQLPFVQVSLREVAVRQFDLLIQHSELLILLDQLGAENIALIDHHIVVLLLPDLLCLGLLYDLLEMPNMVLLVADDFLGRLGLSFGPNLIGFYLLVLGFNLAIFLVVLNEILILILDFFTQLGHFGSHPVVLVSQISDFVFAFQELFAVQVSVAPHSLVQILLMLALTLDFLIVFLQVLNLHIFYLQLFNRMVVLQMRSACLDAVLLLLSFQLINHPR